MALVKFNLPGTNAVCAPEDFAEMAEALSKLHFIEAPYGWAKEKKEFHNAPDYFTPSGSIDPEILAADIVISELTKYRWKDAAAKKENERQKLLNTAADLEMPDPVDEPCNEEG